MTDDITSSVVIDSGCGYTKCDTAGEDVPRHTFPTVIGKVTGGMDIENMGESLDLQQVYVGEEALKKRGLLSLSHPMHRGFIQDWEGMQKIWEHCYTSQLKLNPTESPVLTTCPPHEKKSIKEQTAQIFFEGLNVPGFYCFVNSLLSLYGSGRTTGVVLDSGEEITTVLPIQEGSALSHAQVMVDFGGSDLNLFLHRLLQDKNPTLYPIYL
jgi:actin